MPDVGTSDGIAGKRERVSMIGWHGTQGDFDSFDETYFGSDENRSPNGRLGVWIFLREGLATGIGARVLEVEVDVTEERILRVPNARMLRDHHEANRSDDPHAWFDALRAQMRADGYQAIVVRERDGNDMMAVVLDLDCITRVTDLSAVPGPR